MVKFHSPAPIITKLVQFTITLLICVMASKYRNIKCSFQNIKFDSKLEMERYIFLKAKLEAGSIANLKLQVKYPLMCNSVLICRYIADFEYVYNCELITEDVKGVLTSVFKIKAKMFTANFGRKIKIITKKELASL